MSSHAGPGTILSFLKLRDPSDASQKALESRLEQKLVPKLLKSGGVKGAWLYKAANPAYDKQYVVVYQLSDLASTESQKPGELARASKLSPDDESIDDLVEVDARMYSVVQTYETSKHGDEIAPIIMLAMMQPRTGGEADLDAWYREEHNQQMSEQPGWWRTTRYSLLSQDSSDGHYGSELSFLAVHEFREGNKLGQDVTALEPISDWTKKVMSEAKAIDAAIYHKQKQL